MGSEMCIRDSFWGWAYWYGIYPFHALIFSDMVAAVAKDAEEIAARSPVAA